MGQLAGNLGNPNITGPKANQAQWGDLDSSEKAARLLAGTTGGLAKGFQNYQQQQQAMRQPRMGNTLSFYGEGSQ